MVREILRCPFTLHENADDKTQHTSCETARAYQKNGFYHILERFFGLDYPVCEPFIEQILVKPRKQYRENLRANVVQPHIIHHEHQKRTAESQSYPRYGKKQEQAMEHAVGRAEIDLGIYEKTAYEPGIYAYKMRIQHIHVGIPGQHVKQAEVDYLARCADNRIDYEMPVIGE